MSVTQRRLQLAAVAGAAAVAARAISILAWPPDSDASHARMVATAASHPAGWLVGTYAEVVCWVLIAFAILTAIRVVPGRGFWLTQIGGWVSGVAMLVLGLVGGAMNVDTLVIAQQPERSAMVRLVDAQHASAAMAPFIAVILVGELFLVPFAVGIARSGLAGRWLPVAAAAACVGYVATGDSSNHLVVLAAFVPLALVWLAVSRLLWRAALDQQAMAAPDPGPGSVRVGGLAA